MRLIDADALMDDINRAINAMTAIGIVVDGDWLWAKLNDALDNAPTIEPEPHWIPCSERIPDAGKTILISDGCEVLIGYYSGGDRWTVDGCEYDPILEEIAWMPLPEPWGGDGE